MTLSQVIMAHIFNPRACKSEVDGISVFETSLIYTAISRTVRATHENPLSKPRNSTSGSRGRKPELIR